MNTKWLMLMLPFSASLNAGTDVPSPPAVADFLYAIRQVESGDRYDGPAGPGGELGAYQFRSEVWRQYTDAPFSSAQTAMADDIASRHFWQIVHRLQSHGIEPTTWNIAAAWNGGFRAVIKGRIPRSTRDYAMRVVNLTQYAAGLRRAQAPASAAAFAVGG
jgi:hypothetical protein